MITAAEIVAALIQANEEAHPAQQGYIDEESYGTHDVILDGHFNLERVAHLLSLLGSK